MRPAVDLEVGAVPVLRDAAARAGTCRSAWNTRDRVAVGSRRWLFGRRAVTHAVAVAPAEHPEVRVVGVVLLHVDDDVLDLGAGSRRPRGRLGNGRSPGRFARSGQNGVHPAIVSPAPAASPCRTRGQGHGSGHDGHDRSSERSVNLVQPSSVAGRPRPVSGRARRAGRRTRREQRVEDVGALPLQEVAGARDDQRADPVREGDLAARRRSRRRRRGRRGRRGAAVGTSTGLASRGISRHRAGRGASWYTAQPARRRASSANGSVMKSTSAARERARRRPEADACTSPPPTGRRAPAWRACAASSSGAAPCSSR